MLLLGIYYLNFLAINYLSIYAVARFGDLKYVSI